VLQLRSDDHDNMVNGSLTATYWRCFIFFAILSQCPADRHTNRSRFRDPMLHCKIWLQVIGLSWSCRGAGYRPKRDGDFIVEHMAHFVVVLMSE
jgi:hypothetical protein